MSKTGADERRQGLSVFAGDDAIEVTVPRFLVRPKGEFPGLIRQPVGPLPRQILGVSATPSRVRTTLIVLPPPCFNLALGIGQRQEPVCVEAFIPQPGIRRFAGSAEVKCDAVLISPTVERFRDELWTIAHQEQ